MALVPSARRPSEMRVWGDNHLRSLIWSFHFATPVPSVDTINIDSILGDYLDQSYDPTEVAWSQLLEQPYVLLNWNGYVVTMDHGIDFGTFIFAITRTEYPYITYYMDKIELWDYELLSGDWSHFVASASLTLEVHRTFEALQVIHYWGGRGRVIINKFTGIFNYFSTSGLYTNAYIRGPVNWNIIKRNMPLTYDYLLRCSRDFILTTHLSFEKVAMLYEILRKDVFEEMMAFLIHN